MDHAYGYSLDREAAAILLLSTAREQRRLVDACDQLSRCPFTAGDYAQAGLDGREHQVLDLGEFVLTFWSDHAARMVRILLIERV